MKEHQIYRFGGYTLDPVAKVLFRDGQPVHLTRKAVETLLVLVQNPGTVLTKDEIMAAVWPDRVVDEANLTQNIAVIRKTLSAGPGEPGHIETFPARGYRLEGPVTADPPAHREEPVPQAPPPRRWPAWAALAAVGTGGAIWLWSRGPAAEPPELPFRVSPATRMPGKEFQPSISADGSKLAFLWSPDGGAPTVQVKLIGEDSSRRLAERPGHYSSPAWSADGRRLAYLRIGPAATDVIIADASTGAERLVAGLNPPHYGYDNRLLDWSPDGKWLVVAHSTAADRPLRLMLISVEDGQSRPLTRDDSGAGSHVDPRFSPDGSSVAFVHLIHRSRQELAMVPVSGGEPKQLTEFGRQVSGHDWTADGESIVMASDRAGEFRLWRMPLAGGRVPRPLNIYGNFPIHLALSRRSDRLVYSLLHQDRNIWRLRLAQKSWTPVVASTAQDASPQYSPDGSLICFRSDRSGDEQLWVSKPDGSDAVQVTRGQLRPSVGRWSPDSRAIVFNNPLTKEVFIARRGDPWSVQSTAGTGVHPVFAPAGDAVYAGGDGRIVRIPMGGGEPTVVMRGLAESLNISPDGNHIYFVREAGATALWRVEVKSGESSKVLDGFVPACTSCWALAPNGIYYLGTEKGSFDAQVLYYHDLRTGRDEAVLPYPEPLWPQGSGPFSLSPDGRDLLTVRVGPSNSDVMLVEPFR